MRAFVALALLAVVVSAAPVPKGQKEKKTDAEQFVGTWKCTSEGGDRKVWTHTHTFTADGHLHHKFGTDGTSDWDWSIDPEQSPKVFKFVPKGAKEGSGYHGVYELDGDTLRIAYVGAGSPLPKNADDTGPCLFILTRQPAK